MMGHRSAVAASVVVAVLVLLPTGALLTLEARAPAGGALPRTSGQFGPEPAVSPAPFVRHLANLYPAPTFCYITATANFGLFGPSCGYAAAFSQWESFASSVELTSDKNLMTLLGNSLNITNAFVSNLNATQAELLNYYEQRAEAIVPYFVGSNWTQQVYDEIAIYSGLVPAIEGMEMAYASQEYQDWNATKASWANLYGPSGTFHTNRASLELNFTGYDGPGRNNTFGGEVVGSAVGGPGALQITAPSETWAAATPAGFSDSTYFNLMPGGTIFCVTDLIPVGTGECPTYKVSDYTNSSVTAFDVPLINRSQWYNGTAVPNNLTTLHHIGPFDLLYLQCVANCSLSNKFVQVQGGFAFRNASTLNPDYYHALSAYGYVGTYPMIIDSMIPEMWLGSANYTAVQAPNLAYTLCIHEGDGNFQGPCSTQKAPTEGISKSLGSGPGSVAGSNNSLTRFAPTMQSLVNNTLEVAYAYWLTLHTATDNGKYPIPADCSIPLPSAAFPASIDPGLYRLSTNEILAGYWGYLEAVGKAFGIQSFPNGISFCGSYNLGIHFNWTGDWKLALNISAAIYLGLPNGTGAYPNGSWDPNETLTNPNTWPLHVHPTLLFPAEFQTDITVGTVYPVPFNDPLVALAVNWTGNEFYGNPITTPEWGLPTYLSLSGYGNAVYISGSLSTYGSGRANNTGDAVEVQSCSLNGTLLTTCDLGVVYFNNFTYGHVSGLVGPISPPNIGGGGGTFGSLGSTCGFDTLNAVYDAWLGYIGASVAQMFSYFGSAAQSIPFIGGGLSYFLNGLGCIIGWLVVFIVVIIIVYILFRVVGAFWSGRRAYSSAARSSGGGGKASTVNVIVHDQRRRRG